MFCPQGLRMNLSQYQDNPSLETGTTFSAGTLGRRSGKDNTRTTGGIAPKAMLIVWGHVRSNGHYHYMEAILVLDWMAPASSWQRRQGRWGTCQDCEKRWTLRGRLPRRRGWDLNRTWCHHNIRCIVEKIQICVLTCLLWWGVCVFVCLSREKKKNDHLLELPKCESRKMSAFSRRSVGVLCHSWKSAQTTHTRLCYFSSLLC